MSAVDSASRSAIFAAWIFGLSVFASGAVRASDPAAAAPADAAATPPAASAPQAEPAPATEVASAVAGERVVDRLKLDVTAITGNRELPKVMSIVPWKPAEPPAGPDRPMGSLIEELLTPLDRDEFRREITYYRDLTSQSSASDGETAGPPVPSVAPERNRASPSSPPGASIP